MANRENEGLQALGKKVVAFAIGGLPEACQGKATLVPPGDVDALARALVNVYLKDLSLNISKKVRQ